MACAGPSIQHVQHDTAGDAGDFRGPLIGRGILATKVRPPAAMLFQFHLRARAVLGRALLDVAALAPADLRHGGNIRLPPHGTADPPARFDGGQSFEAPDNALQPRGLFFWPPHGVTGVF